MPIEATAATPHAAWLILPRLRVQNANAISSPLTWGFPSVTAFTGFMTALERKLGPDAGIRFSAIGIICHGFEAQVTPLGQGVYTHSFALTRNPVLQDGGTAAIVEEGRVHLDITLVLEASISDALLDDAQRQACADAMAQHAAGMRLAGGSVMPAMAPASPRHRKAKLVRQESDFEQRQKQFKRLSRQWLPGFALVSRDDVLHARLADMQNNTPPGAPAPTLLDAWLDVARLNIRASVNPDTQAVEWKPDTRPGWLVPMPVGFAALSELHAAGTVKGTRDARVPFRFVESVYSIGQWISPHRLSDGTHLMWRPTYAPDTGLYRCTNPYADHAAAATPAETYVPPSIPD
jgi:CRISPR-associated protein Csy2